MHLEWEFAKTKLSWLCFGDVFHLRYVLYLLLGLQRSNTLSESDMWSWASAWYNCQMTYLVFCWMISLSWDRVLSDVPETHLLKPWTSLTLLFHPNLPWWTNEIVHGTFRRKRNFVYPYVGSRLMSWSPQKTIYWCIPWLHSISVH